MQNMIEYYLMILQKKTKILKLKIIKQMNVFTCIYYIKY